jgi:hypothetical protein
MVHMDVYLTARGHDRRLSPHVRIVPGAWLQINEGTLSVTRLIKLGNVAPTAMIFAQHHLLVTVWVPKTRWGAELAVGETIGG